MSSFNFTKSTEHLAHARVDFDGDTFKAMLVTSVPNNDQRNQWEYASDVSNEITGTAYVAGGFAVTATIGTLDITNRRLPISYSAANPTYSGSTISARGAVIYKDTGTAATSPVLHYVDFGETRSSFDGTFTVTFPDPFFIRAA